MWWCCTGALTIRLRRAGLLLAALLSALFLACGSNVPAHEHPEPLSVAQHEEQAQAHEEQAEIDSEKVESHLKGEEAQCIDIGGPLNSGGERTPVMQPCWTKSEQNAEYLREAARQRKAAQDHRHWAQLLVEAEAEACGPLSTKDRSIGPFMHYHDILSVDEYKEGGKMLGAVVTFRKVPGSSLEWFKASIRCHQAWAAKIGFDPSFLSSSPLALEKVGTSAVEVDNTIVVTLRSTVPTIAAQVYGRSLRAMESATMDESVQE